MAMKLQNLLMPERQPVALKLVSEQVGLTVSEILRRMVDHCLQPKVFFEMIPAVSGAVAMPSPKQIEMVLSSGGR